MLILIFDLFQRDNDSYRKVWPISSRPQTLEPGLNQILLLITKLFCSLHIKNKTNEKVKMEKIDSNHGLN
jgi:hypothetical protein